MLSGTPLIHNSFGKYRLVIFHESVDTALNKIFFQNNFHRCSVDELRYLNGGRVTNSIVLYNWQDLLPDNLDFSSNPISIDPSIPRATNVKHIMGIIEGYHKCVRRQKGINTLTAIQRALHTTIDLIKSDDNAVFDEHLVDTSELQVFIQKLHAITDATPKMPIEGSPDVMTRMMEYYAESKHQQSMGSEFQPDEDAKSDIGIYKAIAEDEI